MGYAGTALEKGAGKGWQPADLGENIVTNLKYCIRKMKIFKNQLKFVFMGGSEALPLISVNIFKRCKLRVSSLTETKKIKK